MDRLSRILGSRAQATSEPENHVLNPAEIRLIAEGKIERLATFAASSRLHTPDPKGDTPLHLAAQRGHLAVCDLFIRSGADPASLNHDRQTPADVAFAEGYGLAAQLLSSLIVRCPESGLVDDHDEASAIQSTRTGTDAVPEHCFPLVQVTEPSDTTDSFDDLLNFKAEAEPEEFHGQYTGKTASGTFVALVNSTPSVSDEDGDWDLDLTPAQIAGAGIGSSVATVADRGAENDFLRVRNRGRQSIKRAVIQTGTRLSINPKICVTWARNILAKGWCSFDDIDDLVARCEGNGDLVELRINLQRTLEAAGFDLNDPLFERDVGFWNAKSDTSSEELAEAIEATLTRATRLPGTQRFSVDKSRELQLLEPLVRAKQELQLGILASDPVVETILEVLDSIFAGIRDACSVSLRTIIPSQPGQKETAEVIAAAETLKSWQANGRVMDGKRRREALAALEALDFSLAFHKELVRSLEQEQANLEHSIQLDGLISNYEVATERLVREHLPYARRFAARNVEEGEDPEDVFQVAYTGLQRSTRRFDPDRGSRFVIYCTFWMKQALTRWRADEGATIRIPVHRHAGLVELDRAIDNLNVGADAAVSESALAGHLGWHIGELRQFRRVPREAQYPENNEAWDNIIKAPMTTDSVDMADTKRVVAEALAELPERQADVIRMRFGIGRDTTMTLEEVGHVYGVTRERIRQIEGKALRYLSQPNRIRGLKTLLAI
ncbi:sigma-70 family RNA polymerase sigma factor [Aurantimonas coralicida]|uniref:sigma-70 family RNA polymerase sigma factor n=1 Tax=Aurantimonas coralicida TaxID=182270 RepID=UPI00239B89DC|nr:sigma-70 family RNA polymerase sigma factor [Aurantimonas coralicida]MDE0922704.1 sigma-70 family RNA polymerase sigma factor [Aurantimonas coralicida]